LRSTLAWQIALEKKGYSPGVIDGVFGPKTRLAIAAVQTTLGLPATGEREAQSASFLGVDEAAVCESYAVTDADAREVEPPTADWLERSRRTWLTFGSLDDLVRERFHTSRRCLERLNPGIDLARLKPGDRLWVPAAPKAEERARPRASFLEIDLERKLILVLREDAERRVILDGLLHCSIAAAPGGAPVGDCRVAAIAVDPIYTFDPEKWPEVQGIDRKLTIPPGPRSPVGIRWIGLDRPGIGIHGSPEPENIGKTGSHGCFRLANWDAAWLAEIVAAGTPVRIRARRAESVWPKSPPAP
jgi:peptidoglycan hydrolase-like protein with peptidoglycan-binding domain